MIPRLQCTIVVALACAPTLAQDSASSSLRPIDSPVRDAGVYHVATGTWSRKASQAALGTDVVFNNDCWVGYYWPMFNDVFVDEGSIPSPSTAPTASTSPGCLYAYTIDGFQIAYCSDAIGAITGTFGFYAAYTPCASVVGTTPAGSLAIPSLPASSGALACWVVTVDLAAGAGAPFVLPADRFGFAFQLSAPSTGGPFTGPIIAGDPIACPVGAGSAWYTGAPAANGTGIGSFDGFRDEGPANPPGCYSFGGSPFASFHLRVYADACGQAPGSSQYCAGNGTGTPCPCGNDAPSSSQGGCLNSVNRSALLTGIGNSSISADSFGLSGSDMTPTSTVLYFQGTTMTSGGSGAAFGDGKRCASGTVVRLGTKTNVNGASLYPGSTDPSVHVKGLVTAPGTRFYQAWYRDPASFCTSATFNLTNGVSATWMP